MRGTCAILSEPVGPRVPVESHSCHNRPRLQPDSPAAVRFIPRLVLSVSAPLRLWGQWTSRLEPDDDAIGAKRSRGSWSSAACDATVRGYGTSSPVPTPLRGAPRSTSQFAPSATRIPSPKLPLYLTVAPVSPHSEQPKLLSQFIFWAASMVFTEAATTTFSIEGRPGKVVERKRENPRQALQAGHPESLRRRGPYSSNCEMFQ